MLATIKIQLPLLISQPSQIYIVFNICMNMRRGICQGSQTKLFSNTLRKQIKRADSDANKLIISLSRPNKI